MISGLCFFNSLSLPNVDLHSIPFQFRKPKLPVHKLELGLTSLVLLIYCEAKTL